MNGLAIFALLVGTLSSSCRGENCSATCTQDMKDVVGPLARQLMLQQLYVEEMTRANGDSGIVQVRSRSDGPASYYSSNHANSRAIATFHQHKNTYRTVGMGEVVVSLNGVVFRTRHNDYSLVMPSTSSSAYHAVEDVPFPEVPPSVTSQATVEDQITEMREWFKAWRDGNTTVRDYRPYFKPVLCYLEGAWTTSSSGDIDEPFDSTRHFIDASSWHQLQDYIRFTSYTGDKHVLENVAYLPTTIMDVQDGLPVYAQWNYRIVCHPLDTSKRYIKPSDLKRVDDLANRMERGMDYDTFFDVSRQARYSLNQHLEGEDKQYSYGLLDELMSEIPGKDNYAANITETLVGVTKKDYATEEPLNTGYYHRIYRRQKAGAMGETKSYRGYNDRNLFVAETTQSKVAPLNVTLCKNPKTRKGCSVHTKRYTYAIPMELMYLTPLSTWNPYDLEFKGDPKSDAGKTVTANGRYGGPTEEKAYNGTHTKAYYFTPEAFFQRSSGGDSADTGRNVAGVLDKDGNLHRVKASGFYVMLPEIEGVGTLRQRYPIMPLHVEGSSIWKELEALRDIVNDFQKYKRILRNDPGFAQALTEAETPA